MGECSCEHLLVYDGFELDVHPDRLVEARRAGRVGGVNAQRDAALPAPVELSEAVLQKRLAITLAAPRPPNAQRADVAAAVPVRVVADDRRDLLAVADQEPERRVVVR